MTKCSARRFFGCMVLFSFMAFGLDAFCDENLKIFELGGYRLGAYPYEHDESELDEKPHKMKRRFRSFDTVETRYSRGRLVRMRFSASGFKGDASAEIAEIAKEIVVRYPQIKFQRIHPDSSVLRVTANLFQCPNFYMYIGNAPLEVNVSVGAYGFPLAGDPFPVPRVTKPIESMFGVKLGMSVEEMIEGMIDGKGFCFEGAGIESCSPRYRFKPKKQFLTFDDYLAIMGDEWKIREISATCDGAVKCEGKCGGEHVCIKTVVDILKKKYGIWFTWKGTWTAEYYGCGKDYTVLRVSELTDKRGRRRLVISLSRDMGRKRFDEAKKSVKNAETQRQPITKPMPTKVEEWKNQALDAL